MALLKLTYRLLFAASLVLSLFPVSESRSSQSSQLAAKPICDASSQKQVWLRVESQDDYRFVDNLRLEDLLITGANDPPQILKLERKQDQPLSVVIVIDTGVSQQYHLSHTKLAGQKFVEWILKSKKDRAALVSFSGVPTVEEELTNDLPKIQSAIGRLHIDRPADYGVVSRTPPIGPRRQGTSAIWDAIWATTDGILQPAGDSRSVIVLLTSGEDSSSRTGLQETTEFAARQDVAVFSIGTTDQDYFIFGRTNLTQISDDTGGRAYFPKKVQDLPDIFRKIEQELRATYLLTFCSAKPTLSPGKIQIELTNPQLRKAKLRLLYRRYVL